MIRVQFLRKEIAIDFGEQFDQKNELLFFNV